MEQEVDNIDVPRLESFEGIAMDSHCTVQNQDSTQHQATNTSGNKRERTSDVWKHYTFFEKKVGNDMIKYARCKVCANEYKAPGSAGTSTCKTHTMKCMEKNPHHPGNHEIGAEQHFIQTRHLQLLARAIILHSYPLSIVEHYGLRDVFTNLNSKVKHVCRNTILKYCIAEHDKFKLMLLHSLSDIEGRVSFTCDLWTACTNRGYLTLTAHYVDKNWCLKSKVLNFRQCGPPHTGAEIEKFVFKLIGEWNLQGKAFAMNVDNARSMDVMVSLLKKDLMLSSPLPCNGRYFHIRCSAHVLNIIVQRGLKEVDSSVEKLREICKYIDSSDSRLTQFENALSEVNCVFNGKLRLDVLTRWNATYTMLRKALEAKEALKVVVDKFLGNEFKLSDGEWDTLQKICKFLRPFFEITTLFSGSEYPTANLYFGSVLKIEYTIHQAHKDPKLAPMATVMLDKFEGYWENYSMILSIAIVLDPRYKLVRVRKMLKLMYVDVECVEKAKAIEVALLELYNFYSSMSSCSTSRVITPPSIVTEINNSQLDDEDLFEYIQDDDDDGGDPLSSPSMEIDSYLHTRCIPIVEGQNFDVLKYWESQITVYPILAIIARDVLAIPITSVASESSFSMGGRILNKYRSALLPKNVEALVTTQNWLRGYDCDCDVEDDVLEIGKEMLDESFASN